MLASPTCHRCFSYPPFWAVYPQYVVDNSGETVHECLMLLPRVVVSRVGFLYVPTFGVGLDRVVGSEAAEVPGAPVFWFRAPVVEYLLFEGVVLSHEFLSYFGEGCVDHRPAPDGERALKPPQRHARDLSRFQVHGPQVVRYHGTGARCGGHGGEREAAVVGDGLGKDGVRG